MSNWESQEAVDSKLIYVAFFSTDFSTTHLVVHGKLTEINWFKQKVNTSMPVALFGSWWNSAIKWAISESPKQGLWLTAQLEKLSRTASL